MLVSIELLKQFVDLKHKIKELPSLFASLGFEVESFKNNILDLEITPNRGDCLSVLGIAREYAALTDQPLKSPEIFQLPKSSKYSNGVRLNFTPKGIAPKYAGLIMNNLKIKDSSSELKRLVKLFGLRPINNIVDITNLVMHEIGVPLHAFDLEKIAGSEMTVRYSKKGENIITLDDKKYILPQGIIIIQDKEKIIDLCGIMGAKNSQIGAGTQEIFLQAAYFKPKQIRYASKAVGKISEASYRYERGIDPMALEYGLSRAWHLIKKEAGGNLVEFIKSDNQAIKPNKIQFKFSLIEKLIGIRVGKEQAEKILKNIGLEKRDNFYQSPSWRSDLKYPEDLAEEIIRIIGYEKIGDKPISRAPEKKFNTDFSYNQKLAAADFLSSRGFTQIITNSFISRQEAEWLNDYQLTKLKNPASSQWAYLRPTLLLSLLKTISFNRWCWDRGLDIFEIGAVFNPDEKIVLAMASFNPEIIASLGKKTTANTLMPTDTIAQKLKIRKPVFWMEDSIDSFEFKNIGKPRRLPQKILAVSNFPPATRDISIIVNASVSGEKIEKAMFSASKSLILAEMFDEFVSDKFGPGKKSAAFHLAFQSHSQTIVNTAVQTEFDKILKKLTQKFQAKLRG